MFKEENIMRRPDLEKNDSLSSYLGYVAQQNPYSYEVFYNFLNIIKPSRILEIGTAIGGFTMFLRLCCDDLKLDTQILSYDIHSRPEYEIYRQNNIDIRIENIFSDDYSLIKNEVIDFIQQEGVTVVLCDGGYKIGEFNLLSNYVKQNDFILAHDYASNFQYFKEHVDKKLWNWFEIEDKNIQTAVDNNNLKSYMTDEFQKAVWVCKVKNN